jgi:hypothetical protein
MEYTGPESADLQDVRMLNAAFLAYLASTNGEPLRREMPESLRPAVAALSHWQIERLAAVPFLLMSVNESDDTYWDTSVTNRPRRDLFTPASNAADPLVRIAAATLGFLWQLARSNPYAVRLVCGASLNWCEQLATRTLLHVLETAVDDPGIVAPRLAKNSVFWHRLLGTGLSSETVVRRASHLSALQTVLQSVETTANRRFRSAACNASSPALYVRENVKRNGAE